MLLCLIFALGLSSALENVREFLDNESLPKWSPTYRLKGSLIIPRSEIQEPFNVWYDSINGKSRIDFYGTMVKTYQLTPAAYPKYGTEIKIVPVTTEDVLNQEACMRSNGTADYSIDIQPVLDNMDGYEYYGTETIGGLNTTKWRLVGTIEGKTLTYIMWVKYNKTAEGDSIPIPVRYERKYLDHYYMEFEEYDVGDIDPDVFKIDPSMECEDTEFALTINPMGKLVRPGNDVYLHHEFDRFKNKNNKQYANEKERNKRLSIFSKNLRYIDSMNRAGLGFTLAVNHLADRTDEELAALRGSQFSRTSSGRNFPYSVEEIEEISGDLPEEYDWRLYGAVTPVKDQLYCASCWAFSATGAVEGALFLHNGHHLVSLSEQALIDCSWGFGNLGCDGGWAGQAFEFIKKHGLPSKDDYGDYLQQDGYCHINNVTIATSIKGWVDVTPNNEDALRLAIFKHGPVSVAIDASQRSFTFYSNGVYYEPECNNGDDGVNHAVLVVGYGTLYGQKYWLIKNSYSNLWGNDGYILMSSKDNNCGVETAPSYVLI